MRQKNRFKAVALLTFALFWAISCSRQPVYPGPPVVGSEVVIDVRTLRPGIPQFYTYRYTNKNINFFVVEIDGKPLSFLDACSSCYPKRLGYRFDNGQITCRACDVRYSVSEIEKGFGSCYPIKVQGSLRDGKYFIQVSALQNMADRF